MPPRYRLKLNRLDFISAVDQPAQETAKVLLIKRRDVKGFARVAKVDDELGLVFCWAFTTTKADGSDYFDLQGDNIDQDFVKACAEFMDGARAVDTMHDGKQSGRVVFAMPMTPEVAKAFGVVTKQVGLMVALRPSADDLAKFKSGEYTGVSIAGLGTREQVGKRKLRKEAVLTSLEDGHQHTVSLEDPSCSWSDSYQTSYQTAEGADCGHAHAWIFDTTTGAITVAADSGHTHTVDAVIPADVLAAYAALDAAEDAENEAIAAEPIPEPIADEESSGKTINVTIAARAPDTKSTRSQPASNPVLTPAPIPTEKTAMPTPEETKIADLEKKNAELAKSNARLERLAMLTDGQRTHLAKLAPADAETYLAKSHAERDAAIAEIEKANEVVYTSTVDGSVYRKSDDPRLIAMAKAADKNADELAKSRLAGETLALEKRVSAEIGNLGGETVTKVAALRAVATIADEKTRNDVITMLKGADAAMAELGKAKGFSPSNEPANDSPLAKFNVELNEFAKSKGKTPAEVTAEFALTTRGNELYTAAENHRLNG